MQDQPVASPINPPGSRHIPYKKLAVLFVALVIVGLGVFWYLRHTAQVDKAKHPYKYAYHQLNSYSLPGTKPGSGIIFKKPVELIAYSSGTPTDQILLSQVVTKNGHTVPFATMAAASSYSSIAPAESYLQGLRKVMQNPTSSSYKAFTSGIKDFTSQRTGSLFDVTLGQSKALTNINQNTWAVDFNATPSQNFKDVLPPMKGQTVFSIGKNGLYYLVAETIDYNWQNKANQKIWQQVINSLQIDQ